MKKSNDFYVSMWLNFAGPGHVCSIWWQRRETLLSLTLVGPSHFPQLGFPCFGLDHINRNPKRSRSVFEKAIKIHNWLLYYYYYSLSKILWILCVLSCMCMQCHTLFLCISHWRLWCVRMLYCSVHYKHQVSTIHPVTTI